MSSSAVNRADLAPPVVREVADGAFAYIQPDGTWWINNTGFVVGRTRITAIDSCATEARTRALLEAIEGVSSNPIRTLVNTHHHGDHTNGNGMFASATIVGHEQCREEMLQEGRPGTSELIRSGVWDHVEWGDLDCEPPFLTYRDGVDLWVDDLRCVVRHVGTPAHSTNDSTVWLPDSGVLFAGDLLFNGGTPFLLAGSVTGARGAIEQLKALPVMTIVPGHGDVAGPGLIDDVLAYVDLVLELARQGIAARLTPLEAARDADLGRFAELTDTERLGGNLHRAYADLTEAPLDSATAISDMLSLNGGHPLTCLA